MKIAVYVTIRSDYFLYHVQEMIKLGQAVCVIPLHEWLIDSAEEPSEVCWRERLGAFLDANQPDVVLSYNRPDEVTVELCRLRQIPICCQERFGNYPEKLPMLFPLTADLKQLAGQMNVHDELFMPGAKGTGDGTLKITLAFSLSCFTVAESIPEVIKWMKSGKDIVPLATYWRDSSVLQSHMSLLRFVTDAIAIVDADCDLSIRVHPRYKERFTREMEWIGRENRSDLRLDTRSIGDCLKETDVLICSTSNMGADALRAGCRVITVEDRAFYAHPQLSDGCWNVDELCWALKAASVERQERRCLKAPVRVLLELAKGALKTSCSPSRSSDTRILIDALKAACSFSQLLQ